MSTCARGSGEEECRNNMLRARFVGGSFITRLIMYLDELEAPIFTTVDRALSNSGLGFF